MHLSITELALLVLVGLGTAFYAASVGVNSDVLCFILGVAVAVAVFLLSSQ